MKHDIAALRERWNQRAQENAMYYIHAERDDWSEAEFLASGEADVARLVDPVLGLLPQPAAASTALDIGCGLGRLTRALAQRFRQAEGIDISPEMVERAERLAPPLPANVHYQVCDGSGAIPLAAQSIDFAFSYIVLQHVPTLRIIETYFTELARILTPGGLALIQLNTQRRPLVARLQIGLVPSRKVPLLQRKVKIKLRPHSTMGVVVDATQCARLATRHQLRLEQMAGAATQYTWLTLRKPV